MSPKALRCALSIISNGQSVSQAEANVVFEYGLKLQRKNKYRISFPIFILIADFFRTFTGFDVSVHKGVVSRKLLLKKLANQDLPMRMTTSATEALIELDENSFTFAEFSSAIML